MIVVTGGAGFVGGNLVRELNRLGRRDIVVVDSLDDGSKCVNLADCDIHDFIDKRDYRRLLDGGTSALDGVEVVFHQGACTRTTETDGRYLLTNNYEFSKALLARCLETRVRLIYASSASVYGAGGTFREGRAFERPLNAYAYSKFLFDEHVRRMLPRATAQVAGLRYFNVYGPREGHKAGMASVAWRFYHQLASTDRVRLFEGSGGFANGEQRRDFVYVTDAVRVNLWLMQHAAVSGIFNVGTGESRTFNDVAGNLIALRGGGSIEYVPFPPQLVGRYQSCTEADLTALRGAGFDAPFTSLEDGLAEYARWLAADRR